MKNNILLITILCLSFFSCEKYTEDLNDDPNNFSSAAPELIIGKAQLAWMHLAESNGARYAGIFMNHFTGEDRQYLTVNNYSITSGEFDDLWEDAYVSGLQQAELAIIKSEEINNTLLAGIGKIVKASIAGEMAALFGDIPYTEAVNFNIDNPVYDSQVSVLANIQTLLNEAILDVGSAPATLYAGNRLSSTTTWAKIANSLKARYFLIAKDYPNALTYAQIGLSDSSESLVSLHGNAPDNRNLYYQFCVDEREGYLGASNSHLNNLLDGTTPRLITTPGDSNRLAYYFNGNILNTNSGGVFDQINSFPIISYEEVKLIEAEAAIRSTNDNITAQNAFNAVRDALSLQYNNGSFPHSTSTGNTLLLEILEEKYITLIGQLQPFHDIRRTNNVLNVPPKTGTEIPQRFLYPQVEIDANSNVPSNRPGLYEATPINN